MQEQEQETVILTQEPKIKKTKNVDDKQKASKKERLTVQKLNQKLEDQIRLMQSGHPPNSFVYQDDKQDKIKELEQKLQKMELLLVQDQQKQKTRKNKLKQQIQETSQYIDNKEEKIIKTLEQQIEEKIAKKQLEQVQQNTQQNTQLQKIQENIQTTIQTGIQQVQLSFAQQFLQKQKPSTNSSDSILTLLKK